MKNLDNIAEELFNKIRGRFPNVTLGDQDGNVTNVPTASRFFDFKFKTGGIDLGSVSVSIDEEKGVTVLYSNDLVANEDAQTRNTWYDFLKELRTFSKKRLLNFNTRDITKSNLNKRDYKFLAKNKSGENNMNESKLYGTSRVSYQDIDNARLVIRHTESVNTEVPTGRTQKVGSIFIDNAQGERFKYPYKHIAGARAMARHVAEGGIPHDDFGKHIVGLSEELAKLRKFKNYMGRSAVMAEGLTDYMDIVKERATAVKKTIDSLQKKSFYAETFESFETSVLEEVPSDVAENWIDELTIRQFNEELKDVFPYIYKLVSENTRAAELGPLDLEGYSVYEGESEETCDCGCDCGKKVCKSCGKPHKKADIKETAPEEEVALEQGFEKMMGQFSEVDTNEADEGKVGTMALFVTDQDGGEHEVEVEVEIKNGKPEIVANTLPGPEDMLYWDDADIEQQAMDAMRDGDIEFDESFDPQSEPSNRDMMYDKLITAYENSEEDLAEIMGVSMEELDQEMTEYAMEHGLHMDDDRDEIVQGVIEQTIDNMDEGNAYSGAVAKAKMNGKKKGDEIDGPDGEKIKLEKEEQKTPLGEFILSHFDKETGEFPKGETAVLTMVEKDYGNKFIEPAKQFIEKVYQTCEAFEVETNPQQIEADSDFDRMRELAGLR